MTKQKAILCIDDEEIILNSLLVQVEDTISSDYIVEAALCADEAFEIIEELKEQDIDLAIVISDYIMPNMKGDALLIAIHDLYPNALKIMLTGQANLDGVQNAINKAQLYRYIAKPWDKNDFSLTLAEAIKSYEIQNNLETLITQRTHELTITTKELENKNNDLNRYINMYREYSLYSETDMNGIITEVSSSFANLTGYSKEELIGNTHSVIKHPNNSPTIFEDLWNTIKSGRTWSGEMQVKTKNKESLWTKISIYPEINDEKEIVSFAAARQDITEKKLIEKLSVTCPLTKLYNRRHFTETMKKELNRSRREKHNLIFMMLDIDHFKLYNDTYGHQKGDDALVAVSEVLRNYTKRGNDFAFRFGGEEFSILTSSMEEKEALLYANTLKNAIENLKIEHEKNSVSKYITISIGIFLYAPEMDYDENQIIRFADNALYQVKERGRNQAILYQGEK